VRYDIYIYVIRRLKVNRWGFIRARVKKKSGFAPAFQDILWDR
jgi:hypothetical protein